jgi:hypothetical protein
MTDVCAVQQRGGASAPITFNFLPAQGRSRSAPVLIIWTRVDRRPSRLHEVLQHPFDKALGPAERRESSTATSAGPAHTHAGSRGPLAVTASAIPAHSTHVMVRARDAAKPASCGPANAGVNGWECPLCRRFLSPTSSPVNLRDPRASRARRGAHVRSTSQPRPAQQRPRRRPCSGRTTAGKPHQRVKQTVPTAQWCGQDWTQLGGARRSSRSPRRPQARTRGRQPRGRHGGGRIRRATAVR